MATTAIPVYLTKTPYHRIFTDQSLNNLSKFLIDLVDLYKYKYIELPFTIGSPAANKIYIYTQEDAENAGSVSPIEANHIKSLEYVNFQSLDLKSFMNTPFWFRIAIGLKIDDLYLIFDKLRSFPTPFNPIMTWLPEKPTYPAISSYSELAATYIFTYIEIYINNKSWRINIPRGNIITATSHVEDTKMYCELMQQLITDYFQSSNHKFIPKVFY